MPKEHRKESDSSRRSSRKDRSRASSAKVQEPHDAMEPATVAWGAILSPPPGRARRWVSLFIAAYLGWQLLLPMTYYLGADQSDERFAWRMFSAVNYLQRTCIVSLGEWRPGGDLRPLMKEEFMDAVPGRWMRFFHRDRSAVIRKFMRSYCKSKPELDAVELLRRCDAEDGSGPIVESLKMPCLTGVVTRKLEAMP